MDKNGLGRMSEMELYKERLQEMEIAFRYNLSLLADRDGELDILEEQLTNGIIQLERVSREKENCQEVLKQMEEEKKREAVLFNKKLIEREKAIKELERRNDANLRTLKKALDDMKREQHQEKQQAEKMFIRVMELKEAEHLRELRRVERKHAEDLDALAQVERERLAVNAGNTNVRKEIREAEQKQKMQIVGMRHSIGIREDVVEETVARTVTEGTMTDPNLTDNATQTFNANATELSMLREQNDVLKRIIKNLKGKTEKGRRQCGECELIKERIEETNKRFQAEIIQVKKDVERERTEEEAIIQSLESSLSSLKEKLVESLAGGDNVGRLEHRLNRRLEKIEQKLEEVTRKVDTGPRAITLNKTGKRPQFQPGPHQGIQVLPLAPPAKTLSLSKCDRFPRQGFPSMSQEMSVG